MNFDPHCAYCVHYDIFANVPCNDCGEYNNYKRYVSSVAECTIATNKNETKLDNVNHPSHYTRGGIECIKAIEASMEPEGFQDYCKGNVLKYIWRWRDKNGIEDLKKAKVYLEWMIESAEKQKGEQSD